MTINPNFLSPGRGVPIKNMAALVGCFLLEAGIWTLFYGVYTDTIGLLSEVYLSELPGVGGLFSIIDEDITVSHLLAALLAFFSCATPVYLWSAVLNHRIHEKPQEWISAPMNKVYAGIGLFMFALVSGVEAVNLYALIARMSNTGPLPTGDLSQLMTYLSANKGLAIFISFLMTIINAAIALVTAKTAFDLKTAWRQI